MISALFLCLASCLCVLAAKQSATWELRHYDSLSQYIKYSTAQYVNI